MQTEWSNQDNAPVAFAEKNGAAVHTGAYSQSLYENRLRNDLVKRDNIAAFFAQTSFAFYTSYAPDGLDPSYWLIGPGVKKVSLHGWDGSKGYDPTGIPVSRIHLEYEPRGKRPPIQGLVTLDDIIEEIVGEIQDEYDQAEENLYQVLNESETVFLGRIDLDDFNELMGTHLPKAEADTLGGFIYSNIGRVPSGGEILRIDDLELTVEQVSGRRIRKVRARRAGSSAAGLPQAQPSAENGVEESHADG